MSRRSAVRRGVTLLELLVVLAILGVMTTVATLGPPPTTPLRADSAVIAVSHARAKALATGQGVTAIVHVNGRSQALTAFPDGMIIGDSTLGLDPLTGFPSDTVNALRENRAG